MSRAQSGVSLVELVIAIVVLSVASAGVLLVYAQVVRHSADPMIQQQAVAVAEAYLDEILARPVDDPSGGETGGSEEGAPSLASSRPLLDDVQDYAGLSNSPPQDQDGAIADLDADARPDLDGYAVDVSVTPNVVVNGVTLAQVDVRVRYAPVVDLTLTGYRAD